MKYILIIVVFTGARPCFSNILVSLLINIYIYIYIDNSSVQHQDVRSFSQNLKPDQSRTILLHCKRISTNKGMYKTSQKAKTKLS